MGKPYRARQWPGQNSKVVDGSVILRGKYVYARFPLQTCYKQQVEEDTHGTRNGKLGVK